MSSSLHRKIVSKQPKQNKIASFIREWFHLVLKYATLLLEGSERTYIQVRHWDGSESTKPTEKAKTNSEFMGKIWRGPMWYTLEETDETEFTDGDLCPLLCSLRPSWHVRDAHLDQCDWPVCFPWQVRLVSSLLKMVSLCLNLFTLKKTQRQMGNKPENYEKEVDCVVTNV